MSVSRRRPKRGGRRRFGLSIFLIAMMPTAIGYQDLAALIARQPAVSERWRQHTYPATFSTFRVATFSFPRPVGTSIPSLPGYTFASLDPRSADITGSIGAGRIDPFADPTPTIVFPQVNRTRKGDLLMPRRPVAQPEPVPVEAPREPPKAAKIQQALPKEPLPAPAAEQIALDFDPENPSGPAIDVPMAKGIEVTDAPTAILQGVGTDYENPSGPAPAVPLTVVNYENPSGPGRAKPNASRLAAVDYENPSGPALQAEELAVVDYENPSGPADIALADAGEPLRDENGIITDDEPTDSDFAIRPVIAPENPAVQMARLFFGNEAFAPDETGLRPWRDGEAPVLIPLHPAIDPDIKRAALDPAAKAEQKDEGETVAPKGEVTGADKRPKTPAERLHLEGKTRAKHERCLTNAIYFEARGESERGQMAVAQVVLNRAFSGHYPDNVCGVVYQNSHRKLACQFTFACDNVRDVVTEPEAWETAKRIARDTLDGKIWLPEIGKATHYHATYVHPWWVRTMKKHEKLGIHIFYRPKRWGDGADAPSWGPTAEVTGSVKAANAEPSAAESQM